MAEKAKKLWKPTSLEGIEQVEWSAAQWAKRRGVSVELVYLWIREGRLGHYRAGAGKRIRITREHEAAFIAEGAASVPSPKPPRPIDAEERQRLRSLRRKTTKTPTESDVMAEVRRRVKARRLQAAE